MSAVSATHGYAPGRNTAGAVPGFAVYDCPLRRNPPSVGSSPGHRGYRTLQAPMALQKHTSTTATQVTRATNHPIEVLTFDRLRQRTRRTNRWEPWWLRECSRASPT